MDEPCSEVVSSLTGGAAIDKYQCDKYGPVSVNKVLQGHRQSYITYKIILIVSHSRKKVAKKTVPLSRLSEYIGMAFEIKYSLKEVMKSHGLFID